MNTPALTDDEVGILVAAAIHAPSMENTQPWRFEVAGPVIDVRLDEDLAVPAADPAGRAIRIGLGAAAFNLRVAAAMLGRESTFAVTADPAEPDVVARIFLSDRSGPVIELSSLYGEISRRQHLSRPDGRPDHPADGDWRADQSRRDRRRRTALAGRRCHQEARAAPAGRRRPRPARRGPPGGARSMDRRRAPGRRRTGHRTRAGADRPGHGPGRQPVSTRPAGSTRSSNSARTSQYSPPRTRTNPPGCWPAWRWRVCCSSQLPRYWPPPSSSRRWSTRPCWAQVRDLIGGRSWPQMILRIGYPAQAEAHTGRRAWRDVTGWVGLEP